MMRRFRTVVVLVSLMGSTAWAHEGGVHAKGVVKEVAPDRVVVKSEGGDVSVAVVPSTRVLRGHEAATVRDIRLGERVVVHARDAGGHLEASTVILPAAKKQ